MPGMVSASSTAVELSFAPEVLDNGGQPITKYVLEKNEGTTGSQFTEVTSYTDNFATHTINTGLTEGRIYSFRWRAVNAVGDGTNSEEVQIAIADGLVSPAAIRKNYALSSTTSISVEWDAVAGGVSPGGDVLGYVLTVEDVGNGTSWTAFNGSALGEPD